MRRSHIIMIAGWLLAAAGCGGRDANRYSPRPESRSVLALDLAMTRPIGLGPAFRPGPLGNPTVAAGESIGRWRCAGRGAGQYGAHIELFAQNHEVQVPGGIGVALPQRRQGVFVRGGRCLYGLRTLDPTGVVVISAGAHPAPSLGELFRLWGQPLSRTRLAGFRGPVHAFVGGRRWRGDPTGIPLARHAQIVVEVGPAIPPHRAYLFPAGL